MPAFPRHLMDRPAQLLARLDAIGRSLERTGRALALLGLGSVGLERERLDAFSDLDFFAVVRPGHKAEFLHDLGWLRAVAPVAYSFQNTVDGHKLLFADGIFCEFAVFEPGELAGIPFAEGRIVWKAPGVPDDIARPVRRQPAREAPSEEWLLGEALTCLYVGLCRFRRGEKLAAARLVQSHAVDRVLELAGRIETAAAGAADPFSPERRFERRFPQTAEALPRLLQGYERTPESALALLAFLEWHFQVNPALAAAVRALCGEAGEEPAPPAGT